MQTYQELGGRRDSVGRKGCPRAGTYGLWFLGRLARGGRPVLKWSLQRVNSELGKNATYAIIAADLLSEGIAISREQLWKAVQNVYFREIGERAATTEQGEVTVALILHHGGELVSR